MCPVASHEVLAEQLCDGGECSDVHADNLVNVSVVHVEKGTVGFDAGVVHEKTDVETSDFGGDGVNAGRVGDVDGDDLYRDGRVGTGDFGAEGFHHADSAGD